MLVSVGAILGEGVSRLGQPNQQAAHAACLPGDTSISCIGVYKVPIDDTIKDMVSTREALKRFAPDLNYVPPIAPPRSGKEALVSLQTQRDGVSSIRNNVAEGRLETAGVQVLQLLPQLTVCGQVLVDNKILLASQTIADTTVLYLRQEQLSDAYNGAVVAWNTVDIMIGQGLRGTMGVSAVAQLQILDQLQEATMALDNFLGFVR